LNAPRWACALLRRVAARDRADDALGDLEEAHARRVERRGRVIAAVLTTIEALDMAAALLRDRRRRTSRGSSFSALDFKLGLRMLVRYPGLTVVGGLAIAFAIWVGAATFEFMTQVVHPTLPLPEGERLVGVRLYDADTRGFERRTVHDFLTWRSESSSLQDWGAFRTTTRNLIVGEGPGEPIALAEMSASGFRVAGTAALVGRTLTATDELPGAPDVIVLGHEVWRTRFASDPAVVGKAVRLGATRATVVGVMPEGFGFPFAHRIWMPLRLDPLAHDWREGPGIQVFARRAPGVTLDAARAEMDALGRRIAAAHPATHARLRVDVLPYAWSLTGLSPSAMKEVGVALVSSNLFLFALLALICSNVALLIFARAAARESEMVVRNALGASRRRIVGQLFVEALVLGTVGAAIGLAGAGYGLRWGLRVVESQLFDLPFWFRESLSPATVLYATLLTVIGAAIAGALPALKLTRGVADRLRQASAGGGGVRFGGGWTAVIVVQVAATVAFPAVSFFVYRDMARIRDRDVGVATERYLAARLEMDREPPPGAPADTSRAAYLGRYLAAQRELERRLLADPAVVGVTFAQRLPKMYHPWNQIEVDEGAVPPSDPRGHRMGMAAVDLDYFDVLGVPILAGRAFDSGDLAADARVVIVNRSFVERVLGGRNPIGRRLRFIASESSREPTSDGPWYDVVGVVPDVGTTSGYGQQGLYLPAAPGEIYPMHMAVQLRGDPLEFAPTLMAAATTVDPTLRLHDIIRLDQTIRDDMTFYRFWLRLTVVVSALALLLSLAGIYAVMAFTVSRRTREIGIRVALGCKPTRVVLSILARPLTQVAFGLLVGSAMVAVLTLGTDAWRPSPKQLAVILSYAALMTVVCMLACVVPTRRALAVEPTEALRAEG
jgi:putative ABC transport system permease protein